MTDQRDNSGGTDNHADIRSWLRQAAEAVDVPEAPPLPDVIGKELAMPDDTRIARSRWRWSWSVAIGAAACVALASTLTLISDQSSKLSTVDAPTQPAAHGNVRDTTDSTEPPTTAPPIESVTTTSTIAGTEEGPDRGSQLGVATRSAFDELDLPTVRLKTRKADFSNPFQPPEIRFSLPSDWEGNRDFTEGGGGRGTSVFATFTEPGWKGRFIISTAGPATPTGDRVAPFDTTWIVTRPEIGSDLIVAYSPPLDGRAVLIFSGLTEPEWTRVIRTAAPYSVDLEGADIPADLLQDWSDRSFDPQNLSWSRSFMNARGRWMWLVVTVSDRVSPQWGKPIVDAVMNLDTQPSPIIQRPDDEFQPFDPFLRCEQKREDLVCAQLRKPEQVDGSTGDWFEAGLSVWRDGHEIRATIPVDAAGPGDGASDLEPTFDLLAKALNSVQVPVG